MKSKISNNTVVKLASKAQRSLLVLSLLGTWFGIQNLPIANQTLGNFKNTNSSKGVPVAIAQTKPPVVLGLYTNSYLGTQAVIDTQLRQLDQWAGKRNSVAGMFMDIEDPNPAYNVVQQLELLQQNGYTTFINLKSTRTAAEIANGNLDTNLRNVAQAYRAWLAKGKGRRAFIAPLQEMNIPGEKYSLDQANFKLAYQRIQRIFTEVGVPRTAVRWVFAPNGWSQTGHEFEKYYPGSNFVDVVAFSAYNWGYCSNADWKEWRVNPATLFSPYITRMQTMAPTKPIFIAQTGSTSQTSTGSSSTAKDKWFRDTYTYLAGAPKVQGILYFNIDKECDWALYRSSGAKSVGYKDAIANPAFSYISPANLSQMTF
ncbi:MAG TPA: hypothetical protein V6D15_18800 [Oculatellaceae cyanobacterium]|jgi:hypothetical protein